MDSAGLIELGLVFGVALAIGGWELWTLRRDRRRAAARDAARKG